MAGNKESSSGIQDSERELTCVMLRTVVTLLKGSVRNTGKDITSFAFSLLRKIFTISWLLLKAYIQGITNANAVGNIHLLFCNHLYISRCLD
jgi:hypothetical protein